MYIFNVIQFFFSRRYQLLLVLSKEMVAKWQNITENHKTFDYKLAELKSLLDSLENKPAQILNDDALDLNTKLLQLQSLCGDSDKMMAKISLLTTLGESLYSDTSAAGREVIRKQLKDIRERLLKMIENHRQIFRISDKKVLNKYFKLKFFFDFYRWDTLDEQIKTAQKTLGAQSQQWNSYQETLLQTINWLEGIEKSIASNQSTVWSSPQEIRSKLLKQKVWREI